MENKNMKQGQTHSAIFSDAKRAYLFQLLLLILLTIIGVGLIWHWKGWPLIPVYWAAFSLLAVFFLKKYFYSLAWPVLRDWWKLGRDETRRLLSIAAASTAVFSFTAHGFLFTNELYSHDSSTVTVYDSPLHYIPQGRFMIPFLEKFKGLAPSPWLTGLLFVLILTAVSMLLIRIFNIQNSIAIFLICGLLCTNEALTLTGATYVYCMDEYAFALLAAAAAAWFFCRCPDGAPLGIICLIVCLAIYQSYFTVTLALCFITLIHDLTANEKPLAVIFRGLRYLALALVSFIAYFFLWWAACRLTGTRIARTDQTLLGGGLSNLFEYFTAANDKFFSRLLSQTTLFGIFFYIAGLAALLLVLFWLISWLAQKDLSIGNKALLVIMVFLLPTALNSVWIFLAGQPIELSTYGWQLIYLFPILCAKWAPFPRLSRQCGILAVILLAVVLWNNVLFANHAYMKKDLEKNATIFLISRVIDRVEQTEGYIPNETPVAYVGKLSRNPFASKARPGFSELSGHAGLWYDTSATYFTYYISRYLNYPMVWDTSTDFASMEEVQAMPLFPAAGCTRMINGTLVIRLS